MHIRIGTVALSGLLLGSLFFGLPAKAADFETLNFHSLKSAAGVSMQGYFSHSQTISPGDLIFLYGDGIKSGNYQTFQYTKYTFAGRTGEKTFDLMKTEGRIGNLQRNKQEERKISVYFDSGTPLPLGLNVEYSAYTIDGGCAKDDLPKLKMIKLTGNELEVQVLLPECLKK